MDIGAYTGVTLSNTYALEKNHGWHGICVEPHPRLFDILTKVRTAFCSNKAVYSESGKTLQFIEADVCSGFEDYIDCHTWIKEKQPRISVETISFNDLMEEGGAPSFIDYMSIDTEGSEYEILKTIDFSKYTIGYIDVEHNNVEPRRSLMRKLLVENGFIYAGVNGSDDKYIHESLLLGTYTSGKTNVTVQRSDTSEWFVSVGDTNYPIQFGYEDSEVVLESKEVKKEQFLYIYAEPCGFGKVYADKIVFDDKTWTKVDCLKQ